MAYRVRFVEPDVHYRRMKAEIDSTIQDVLARGDLVYRSQLKAFEEHLASFVGTRFAVGVNSGFHALHFSVIAAGIGPGDEVIVPAHTFVASVSAIALTGARPVLVDAADDYNMDIEDVERARTPRTKGIIPVHLNGRLCDMDRIMVFAGKHGLVVIEDAAQALGATLRGKRAGSFGLTGCFSFYPFKVLGAFGDAGALVTDDENVAKMVSRLRYNGEDRETGEYHCHGQTALLDNVQAAVLDVKLRRFPEWVARRRAVADRYRRGLEAVGDLRLPHFEGPDHLDVFQNYVVRTRHRDALRAFLKENGVETLVHWTKPLWEHSGLKLPELDLKNTAAICREVISLPLNAEITDDSVDIVVEAVRRFFERSPARDGEETEARVAT